MVFFAMLGLACLLAPKLIYGLYKEITQLGSAPVVSAYSDTVSVRQLSVIRVVGIGVLAVVGKVYFF